MKIEVRKIAVLVSGEGTTLQAIIDAIESDILDLSIEIVISDRECFALESAKHAGIDKWIIDDFASIEELNERLYTVLTIYNLDLIVLAGYLKPIGTKILEKYTVINTHPALLPKYGGKGMYGMHVHKAVVNHHETVSGVTLHFVNEQYDKGPIIWQTPVPVFSEDTAEEVSERVQAAEKTQLVSILKAFSEGKIDF